MPVNIASLLLLLAFALSASADQRDDLTNINELLDGFHQAAADGDEARYLGYFADHGVFMGTDDWERWPLDDFREYVHSRFSEGGGWTYTSEERHIAFSRDGHTAWFDEIMVSERWGRFRGTGVLTHETGGQETEGQASGEWKLAHYSLTALVPNERFEDVSAIANEGFEARKQAETPN